MNQEIKILGIVGLLTVLLVGGAVFLLDKQNTAGKIPDQVDTSLLVRDYSHKIASDSAKTTLVEFADFQCPACAAAFPTVQKIKEEYAGKINFVYRNFPLMQHPYGKLSAKAAEAAAEQNKFWEMYAKLFQTQEEWSSSSKPQEVFDRLANEIGLDLNKFHQDMNDQKISDRINSDLTDAQKLQVNSTPTFFLDGERLVGAPNYNDLKAKIDAKIGQ